LAVIADKRRLDTNAGPPGPDYLQKAGGTAATHAVSALCLARLRLPTMPPARRETTAGQLRTGWVEFRSRTWLWVIVTQFGLFHLLVYAPFMVLGAVIASTTLGGPAAWGFILTAQGAGAILGGIGVLRMHPRRPLVAATVGTFAFAGPVALLAARAPTGAIVAAAVVPGAGIAVFGTLWDTTLQQHIPAAALSRVSAYDWLGSVALIPLGYALTGPLASTPGVTGTQWLAAAWTVLGRATAIAVPAVRRLHTPPQADHRPSAMNANAAP
jgi:predicted MFS family arabinose efflux permease